MYNQKTNFTTDELMQPIPKGSTFNGIFTRREKTKLTTHQFYLYSQDAENLLLSSTNIGPTRHFVISTSANEIKEGSEFHIASSEISGYTYNFTDVNHKPILEVTYKSFTEKKTGIRKLEIKMFNKNHEPIEEESEQVIQRMPHKVNNQYSMVFPSIPISGMCGKQSEKNLILEYKDEICFIFEKTEEDEFYLAIRYPLNIVQGFCIALTAMSKFATE
ncbi:hypothetical protein TVAG_325620 [Trichomonas vaginalis G3]|uniref:Uncharacterized protein n=1 Tax=Trichomonas vaginalis (strain ATCC PRA-98 / G3) TaxID=412133 RepID=A2EWG3_TRIV3|nr:tubby c-terminal domain-like family [Trichomonas vaginalis G3]EAY02990.1 hypothetical protein TVAG_325620 [Trichomonas vaginalis G3]KAI5501762.1 tubby c-terminal domain-like family [Trichomonas vaginalis G3]|eukprot:XP_001315213.1 hypothetical protein [Trichomonas vaginalis G3]